MLLEISILNIENAKYLLENEFTVANINIDRNEPKIEILNTSVSKDASNWQGNKKTILKINFKIIENNIQYINLNEEYINIKINNNKIIENIQYNNKISEDTYQIEVKNLSKGDKIEIKFLEGFVIDKSKQTNIEKELEFEI